MRAEKGMRRKRVSPMIPIVTVITSYHGTTVIRFVASRTNPDLVSPFISDLSHIYETEGVSDTLVNNTISIT